jgi:hypothetical protein
VHRLAARRLDVRQQGRRAMIHCGWAWCWWARRLPGRSDVAQLRYQVRLPAKTVEVCGRDVAFAIRIRRVGVNGLVSSPRHN